MQVPNIPMPPPYQDGWILEFDAPLNLKRHNLVVLMLTQVSGFFITACIGRSVSLRRLRLRVLIMLNLKRHNLVALMLTQVSDQVVRGFRVLMRTQVND